ncbi:hypothetical protein MSAN_01147600 [Mycena sanguinolenta]|uniref:DUF6534 domain-containing protein n=1 Tax=Mycena sanguinolenta TaxID=230812 RepID=A0A8H6YH67_9AGAR|nr:hypothetical protein MSAN_01147600 [Mycena sanguinolenta]
MSEVPQTLLAGPLVNSVFVGVVLNWALLGALIIQLYDYHSHFQSRDRLPVRILVHSVSVIELVQTGFITHVAWWHLVRNWGKSNDLPWTGIYIPILNGLASASVQGFYAWRIWLFEMKSLGMFGVKSIVRVSAVVIVLTALTQFSASIWVGVQFERASRDITKIALIRAPAETWLIGSFVCDLLIAVTMVAILVSARRLSSTKRTMFIINNLIINTVETGAVTAVLALTELILYELSPNTYMHIAVEFILGRLYCNVLLAALNGRARETGETDRDLANVTSVNFHPETEAIAEPINLTGINKPDDNCAPPTASVATTSSAVATSDDTKNLKSRAHSLGL